jgi:iron complex outermembrane receptor protein
MKFLFGCFLSAFLTNVYFCSHAQTGYASIKGAVFIQDHQPAVSATISLLKYPDSSLSRTVISDQNGNFEIGRIDPGNYIISVREVDYHPFYTGQYHFTSGKNINLGQIVLLPLIKQLGEVTVTAKKDYIELLPGKTVLNVDRSILAAGANVYDVLATAPGVRLNDDGVLLKGGEKALVAINGKPIGNLNGAQLADLLKSYQSSQISQIELIENPSAKYDAAGGGGVINIILKKNKDIGFRASIFESAAYGQDYKLTTGINLNYRLPKVNFFGSYGYADNKTPRILDIDRNINNGGLLTNIDVNYNSITYIKISNFNGGGDFNISHKQTVGVLVFGYASMADIDKGSVTHIQNNRVLDSNLTTRSHIDRPISNINYNLNYKGSFGKTDATSLTADFDYATYNRNSNELLQNNYYLPNGTTYRNPIFYRDNSPSNINVWSQKVDFSQALTPKSMLSAGLKHNQVNTDNIIDFSQSENGTGNFMPVPALTDHFVYNERINALYASYNAKFNKSDLTIGLRAEHTYSYAISYHPDRVVSRRYFDLFPNLVLTQAINDNNKITIDYNRRIGRPNYQDLNPFVGFIGQYSYSTGNPFLKPQYSTTYSVSDLYKEKYKVSLSMIVTKDFFTPIYLQNDSTKIYTTTYNNIGKRYQYELKFSVPVTITKWWRADIYLRTAYEKYVYNADSAKKTTYDIDISADQNFEITKGLTAEVFAEWESPTYYGIKQYRPQATARAGISQSILQNRGSIKLSVSDIFNSDQYRYTSNYINLDLTGKEKSGSRFVALTFVYHFGKQTVSGPQKRSGDNADEQKRLGGSTNEN